MATASEIAKQIGVNKATLSKWRKREGCPPLEAGAEAIIEWHDATFEDRGPKALINYNDEPTKSKQSLEDRELSLALQINKLDGGDPNLPVLRQKFEAVAEQVLQKHLDMIDRTLNRRLVTCPGFSPDEAFEKYVSALSDVADRWQEVIDAGDDESTDDGISERK
jgi:hypothetical protein